MKFGIPKTDRDGKYIKYIKTLPCAMCGRKPVDPHHESGLSNESGMGIKVSDFLCIGLCYECHAYRHQHGYETFWQNTDAWRIVFKLLVGYIKENDGTKTK